MQATRDRILEAALDVLGRDPETGLAAVAAAARVVRRTVYGHFPTRADLIVGLTHLAVDEMRSALREADSAGAAPDEAWTGFVVRLWPLAHRHRVLLALRRGAYGDEIHALLAPLDDLLTDVVARGQASGRFGTHLPADLLSRVAESTVFTIADHGLAGAPQGPRGAAVASLLILGVPPDRIELLLRDVTPDPGTTTGAVPEGPT